MDEDSKVQRLLDHLTGSGPANGSTREEYEALLNIVEGVIPSRPGGFTAPSSEATH